MKSNRLAPSTAVVAGLALLCMLKQPARADRASQATVQTPNTPVHRPQPAGAPVSQDDFAGLNYTAEQKAEIEKILQDAEVRKNTVAKDEHLTQDQKDAMLIGYTRLEYGAIFKVLSPEQQMQVRKKILARRAADTAAQKRQPPAN